MRYNKDIEKYPCYKVVSESGDLCGYSALDGVKSKIRKLENDGIKIVNNKVDKKYFIQFMEKEKFSFSEAAYNKA